MCVVIAVCYCLSPMCMVCYKATQKKQKHMQLILVISGGTGIRNRTKEEKDH